MIVHKRAYKPDYFACWLALGVDLMIYGSHYIGYGKVAFGAYLLEGS